MHIKYKTVGARFFAKEYLSDVSLTVDITQLTLDIDISLQLLLKIFYVYVAHVFDNLFVSSLYFDMFEI